jgi:hypothetical protein
VIAVLSLAGGAWERGGRDGRELAVGAARRLGRRTSLDDPPSPIPYGHHRPGERWAPDPPPSVDG